MTSVSTTGAGEVFDRYLAQRNTVALDGPARVDELMADDGTIRAAWAEYVGDVSVRGDEGLARSARRLSALLRDDGVTYNTVQGDTTVARQWELDSVPLVIDGHEWAALESGLAQRAELLDALLADIYGDQATIGRGKLPPELVFGHPGYIRKVARLGIAGRSLFLHAADLGRGPDGRFMVFGDKTQAPSGIGYAMADRKLMSRAVPRVFQHCGPRPITTFAQTLRLALTDSAPSGVSTPTVAVLSPGSLSETAFDQAYLASNLGYPLVEAGDLVVRDGALYMRSLGRFKRVDVLLRRVDAAYCDPLDLRTDSRLGVAGLVEAISRGQVSVVNTLGSGVLENPALHVVLGDLARDLLDADLILPSVPTLWAGDELARTKITAELGDLLIDNFHTGEQLIGPFLGSDGLDELRRRIEAQPWQWVARTLENFSQAPSVTPSARRIGADILRPAPTSLRTFAVAHGSGYSLMPGGLGAVLLDGPAGSALGSTASKDVWVTTIESGHQSRVPSGELPADEVDALSDTQRAQVLSAGSLAGAPPRVLSDMFWFGRYGERAESTTRMLSVARERYHAMRYRPWMSGTAAVGVFLRAVAETTTTTSLLADVDTERMPGPGETDAAIDALVAMTVDRHYPGTVAHAVDRLIAAARAERDQMSTSTWMILGSIEQALVDLAPDPRQRSIRPASVETDGEPVVPDPLAGLHADAADTIGSLGDAADPGADLIVAHARIMHGLLALTGVQAESMVHDPGWLMMDAGRRIERGILLAGLSAAVLVTAHDPETEQGLLEAYLIANESSVIYRRRTRGVIQLAAVLALMMFDESNPRSMIFALTALRRDLTALPDEIRSASAEREVDDLIAELRRVDTADLVSVSADGRRVELAALMTTISAGLVALSSLIERTRFASPTALQPLWGAGIEELP